MNPFQVLFFKELRQNSFIYAIPFLFVFIAQVYQAINPQWLSTDWAQIIALVVPLALACSYGLQAFDLEENSQTRDFLITRPLSVSTILWAKFSSGLFILLPLTLIWSLTFFPQQVKIPFPLTDFRNIWFTAFIILVFIVYLASLAAGVWIKGPTKLLVGAALSVSIALFFFFGWFEAMTYIYLNLKLNSLIAQLEAGLIMITVTTGFLYLLINLFHHGLTSSLSNEFSQPVRKSLLITLSVLLLLPVMIGISNWLDRPAIQPFHSLYSTLFNREKWFVGSQGHRQYQGVLYVFADRNWLGTCQINQKPNTIYQAPLQSMIYSPIWSPDGTRIAMMIDQKVAIYDLFNKKLIQKIDMFADQIAWSSDGNRILVAHKVNSRELGNSSRKSIINAYIASQVNLATGLIQKQNTFSFPGTSFAWDSIGDQIIGLELYGWIFGKIDLGTNKTKLFQIPPHSNERVVYSRIIPLSIDSRTFRIVLLTFDNQNKRKIYIYKYNNFSEKLVLISVLKNPPLYRDLVSADSSDQILISKVDGVYRLLTLPRGVEKDGSTK